ncbi:transporter substrate-binding domain-containing protein [Paeniroseomonas aquatica]|uniref:transporter substrate-binding domain-containing protein n=1 Tax=Paeniroseomonas aquatica TaxID=373043 RepID=UPI0036161C68
MFRRLLLGAAFVAAALPALAQTCTPKVPDSELSKPRTLVLSTNPTLPPMQFVNAQGQLVGMRVELGAEIAKRLCLAVENVRIEFAAMIPGLAARRWDMINTGMFYTEERAKLMYLVRYEEQAISISVPRGNPRAIRRLEDLAGLTVGVEQGGFEFRRTQDIATELTGKNLRPITIRPFDISPSPSSRSASASSMPPSPSTAPPRNTTTAATSPAPSPASSARRSTSASAARCWPRRWRRS